MDKPDKQERYTIEKYEYEKWGIVDFNSESEYPLAVVRLITTAELICNALNAKPNHERDIAELIDCLKDMEKGDDGHAWKVARRLIEKYDKPTKEERPMTTTVIVKACCDPTTTQVRVDRGSEFDYTILSDGESSEFSVYDDVAVSVREMASLLPAAGAMIGIEDAARAEELMGMPTDLIERIKSQIIIIETINPSAATEKESDSAALFRDCLSVLSASTDVKPL